MATCEDSDLSSTSYYDLVSWSNVASSKVAFEMLHVFVPGFNGGVLWKRMKTNQIP